MCRSDTHRIFPEGPGVARPDPRNSHWIVAFLILLRGPHLASSVHLSYPGVPWFNRSTSADSLILAKWRPSGRPQLWGYYTTNFHIGSWIGSVHADFTCLKSICRDSCHDTRHSRLQASSIFRQNGWFGHNSIFRSASLRPRGHYILRCGVYDAMKSCISFVSLHTCASSSSFQLSFLNESTRQSQ